MSAQHGKIYCLHKKISTNSLLKIKIQRLFLPQYLLYKKNTIIDDFYQPHMILRRKICQNINFENYTII